MGKTYILTEATSEEIKKAGGAEDSEDVKKLKKELEDLKEEMKETKKQLAEAKKAAEKKEAKGDGKETCPTCGEEYEEEDTEGEDCAKCKAKAKKESEDEEARKKKEEEDKKILDAYPGLVKSFEGLQAKAAEWKRQLEEVSKGQPVRKNFKQPGVGGAKEPSDEVKTLTGQVLGREYKEPKDVQLAEEMCKSWGERPEPLKLTLRMKFLDAEMKDMYAPVG